MCVQGKKSKFCSCPERGEVPASFWKYLTSRIDRPAFVIGEALVPYVADDSSIEWLASKVEADLNSPEAFDFDFTPHSGDCMQVVLPKTGNTYRLVFKFDSEEKWKLFHVESNVKPRDK